MAAFRYRRQKWARPEYVPHVGVLEAAAWGLTGGVVAGLLAVAAEVRECGFRWPWHGNEDGIWPRLFVFMIGVIIGGSVAAAAHGQMTSQWPAFIMGVAAPSVVRGAIGHGGVAEVKKSERPSGGGDDAEG